MIPRSANLSKTRSFFLFGARGTGKTTLLRSVIKDQTFLNLDLLDSEIYEKLLLSPNAIKDILAAYSGVADRFCVIDEIQKLPKLLDVVHQQIFEKKCLFALTGSSARKLKREGANMLAGRASLAYLFPLTYQELLHKYEPAQALEVALTRGALPEILSIEDPIEQTRFLKAYINTYLREEIIFEQVVRQLRPFRLFLELAAQYNGEEIHFAKISRQLGIDDTTVRTYFEILEDTLVGFMLYSHDSSFRKRVVQAPKFYFFDVGVKRMLVAHTILPIAPRTEEYGKLFEHFLVLECYRRAAYLENGFEMSYLRTHDGKEIDLVIVRPGSVPVYIEIKATTAITREHIKNMLRFKNELEPGEYYCLSQDSVPQKIDGVLCLPWQEGLSRIGL